MKCCEFCGEIMGYNEKYCRNCNRMTKSNNTAPSDEAAKEIAKEVKEEIAEEPVKNEESVSENNNAKICSRCGAKLPDEAKVCPICGCKVKTSKRISYYNKIILITVIAGLVIIASTLLICFIGNNRASAKRNSYVEEEPIFSRQKAHLENVLPEKIVKSEGITGYEFSITLDDYIKAYNEQLAKESDKYVYDLWKLDKSNMEHTTEKFGNITVDKYSLILSSKAAVGLCVNRNTKNIFQIDYIVDKTRFSGELFERAFYPICADARQQFKRIAAIWQAGEPLIGYNKQGGYALRISVLQVESTEMYVYGILACTPDYYEKSKTAGQN